MKGHTLWYEGKPHDDNGIPTLRQGVGGTGRAKCSCGAMSDILPSGYKRKQWHRDHKEAIATRRTT